MYRHNPNLTIYPPDRSSSPTALSSSFGPTSPLHATTPTTRRFPLGGSPTLSPTPVFAAEDDDDEIHRPPSRKGTLPLFNSPHRLPISWSAFLRTGLRGRKARLLLAAVALLVCTWYMLGQPVTLPVALGELRKVRPSDGHTADESVLDPSSRPPKQPPSSTKAKPKGKTKRPRPDPVLAFPVTPVVDVDVWPKAKLAQTLHSKDERFLAYSPHSGYHNQRISLENALTLAFILGRTLLLPPLWVGHAIPYLHFDKMQYRLRVASKEGLDRCLEGGEGGAADPLPRECEGFFDWTLVHWGFLVDLADARQLVPTRDRWNHTEAWLEDELGLAKHDKEGFSTDTFYLKDQRLYEYRFYDTPGDMEPLAKFETRIDLEQLARDSANHKLVHVGTLFGTSRFRVQDEANFDARSVFRRSMVFKNPLLNEIAGELRDRLGGSGKYYGLHLRVGDGIFQHDAAENMAGVWDSLCLTKMKQSEAVCSELASASLRKRGGILPPRTRRSTPAAADDDEPSLPPFTNSSMSLARRANSRPQREGAYHHAPLPAIPVIRTRADSPLDSTLSCRGELHTEEHLLPFNAPLFIATDAKIPTADRHLAIFFDAFPCTFILGDFSGTSSVNSRAVDGLGQLAGLRNKVDKVPLAQFLYPQLDAQIAAYGRGLVGTPQSTYSRFAIDVLHQYYHGWDIVERG